MPRNFLGFFGATLVAMIVFATGNRAEAVPSYARQTGLACEACHTIFPELTPFGRRFKLGGYTLTTKPGITDINEDRESRLSLADFPPLSMMVQASTTWFNKAPPDSQKLGDKAQNGAVQFPQQLSIFYAGRVADNLGAYLQMTYSQQSGSVQIDNSDIRYANHTDANDLLYGISINNNPSVQDVWNSTPAWGFPSIGTQMGPAVTQPQIMSLGQAVAGVGAYAMYKDQVYLEASVYRSAISGKSLPYDSSTLYNNGSAGSAVVNNYAPYWRAAYERQWGHNSLELGSFGMYTEVVPNVSTATLSPATANSYLDAAADMQYQYITDRHIFTLSSSYLHESIDNNGSRLGTSYSNASDSLDRYQATAAYYYRRKFGGNMTFVRLTGSPDALLYSANSLTGFGKGKPDTQYEVIEADYMPWLNTKILLQYTMYNQFNGGSAGYDGTTDRRASDNNMLMIALWTAF